MHFAKLMQSQLEDTIPEWREKFLCYKLLKKRLKSLQAPLCFTGAVFARSCSPEDNSLERDVVYTKNEARGAKRSGSDSADSDASGDTPFNQLNPKKRKRQSVDYAVEELSAVTADDSSGIRRDDENSNEETEVAEQVAKDTEFIRLLIIELDKFNHFFMEREERYVIRLHHLKKSIEKVKVQYAENGNACDRSCEEECTRIQMDIVALHGEMVLLENYSTLNYIGLVKILKKHDKQTGAVLRTPFIVSVLHQPFFSTELLSRLVLECLECADSIRCILPPITTNEAVVEEGVTEDASLSRAMKTEPIHRQTLAALRTIQAMRKA